LVAFGADYVKVVEDTPILSASLMKLFRTSSANIVKDCQNFFVSYQLVI